ncbi:MAG TPA: aryl-sulfate sulfotransferase [Bacteroidia bacterium]|nr:aryl-sulfate sulfotransferase [Bacteroidia bacterium]
MKIRPFLSTFIISAALFAATSLSAQQWGHYTLYGVMGNSNNYLIDTNNTVYHTWALGANYRTGYSSYLIPGGTLVKSVQRAGNSFSGGPITGQVIKADWNGNIIWDYVYSTTQYCTHHDICPMPNGNVLLIAYERKTAAEVAAAGCTTFSGEMWPDKIVEVQPTGLNTGTVVWEWHAWDHLVQSVNSSLANYQTSIVNHPELLNINYSAAKDWMHMNGVDYNPMLDQITFSCHNLHEIYVIDHSTTTAEAASHSGGNSGKGGDILYRWGKPSAYNVTPSTTIINVVHDAHWIKEGSPNAGRLVCFNNRGVSNTQSAVDQVSSPVNGYVYAIVPGQAFQPTSYTQRHACNGYSSNMGGSQQLPNGNMLVCVATAGSLYEIDSAGNTIWSFNTGGSNAKAFRYDDCYVNNTAPAIPTITETSGTLDASSATTYQWYINGQPIPGATNQSCTPAADGIYVVRITDANGCVFRYSAGYHFALPAAVENISKDTELNFYPNPSTGLVSINENYFGGKDFEMTVYDSYGKLVAQQKNYSTIDLSSNSNGIYNVAIRLEKTGPVNRKIILIR